MALDPGGVLRGRGTRGGPPALQLHRAISNRMGEYHRYFGIHREVSQWPGCPPGIEKDRHAAVIVHSRAPRGAAMRLAIEVRGTHLQGDAGFEELLKFLVDRVHQGVRSAPK